MLASYQMNYVITIHTNERGKTMRKLTNWEQLTKDLEKIRNEKEEKKIQEEWEKITEKQRDMLRKAFLKK